MEPSEQTVCVVQARVSSQRVPGKVLAQLAEEPVLTTLLRRLARVRSCREVIVATSDRPEDGSVAALAAAQGVRVVRGSLENVAHRFLTVAREPGVGALVRICADSPFMDPVLIDQAVRLFWRSAADLVTTSNPRTTPSGLSVEVLAAAPFCTCYDSFQDAADFEHVTRAYYRNRAQYRIVSFVPPEPIALDRSLAIDTPADLAQARRIARQLGSRLWEASAWQIAQCYRQLESFVELETETAAVCVPE